jgi:hypothetical protein
VPGCVGWPGAHVLCLIQYRGQAPLFDGQVQMKPCQVAAGLGDFGQPVVAQIDHRQRLRYGAQLRHEFRTGSGNGVFADDDGEAFLRAAVRRVTKFGQIVDVDRLEVQKSQQRLQRPRLRI